MTTNMNKQERHI